MESRSTNDDAKTVPAKVAETGIPQLAGLPSNMSGLSVAAGKRIVMWQIPLGNTKMRTENNSTGHYQDNRPQWLLDDPARSHLAAYRDAGVVAFLFGRGSGGNTCAFNSENDGVTNPS